MKVYKKLLILTLLLFTFNIGVNSQGRLGSTKKELIKELRETFKDPVKIDVIDGVETVIQHNDNEDLIFLYRLTDKIKGSKEQWVQYSSIIPLTNRSYEEVLEYLDEFYFARPDTWISYHTKGKIVIIRTSIPESVYPIFIFTYDPTD